MNKITVISAFELNKDMAAKIEKIFNSKHDCASEFVYQVDSSLIGGILIIDGDNFYDASIKGQLLNIKKSLK